MLFSRPITVSQMGRAWLHFVSWKLTEETHGWLVKAAEIKYRRKSKDESMGRARIEVNRRPVISEARVPLQCSTVWVGSAVDGVATGPIFPRVSLSFMTILHLQWFTHTVTHLSPAVHSLINIPKRTIVCFIPTQYAILWRSNMKTETHLKQKRRDLQYCSLQRVCSSFLYNHLQRAETCLRS